VSFPIHGNSLHVTPCVRVIYYTVSLVPVLYQHGHIQTEEMLEKGVGILVLNLHLPSCNNFTANLSLFIKNLTQPTMPTIHDKCSAVVSCRSNHLQRRPTCSRLYLSRKKQKTEEEPEDVIPIDDNSSVEEDMSDINEEEDFDSTNLTADDNGANTEDGEEDEVDLCCCSCCCLMIKSNNGG
jgi:hypothetical protein